MKKTITLGLILALYVPVFGQFNLPIWSIGNAKLTPRQVLVLNSTFTSRYNLNGRVQLGFNLFVMGLAPNAQVKILLWDKEPSLKKTKFYSQWRWYLTTVHTAVAPVFLFRVNRKLNFIDLPSEYPINLTTEHDLLLSIPLSKRFFRLCETRLLTFKLGWRNTIGADSSIILPNNGFWRIEAFTLKHKNLFFGAVGYDTKIRNNLNLSESLRFYVLNRQGLALENTSFLYFGFGLKKKATIAIGLVVGYISMNDYRKPYVKFGFNYSLKLTKSGKSKKLIYE